MRVHTSTNTKRYESCCCCLYDSILFANKVIAIEMPMYLRVIYKRNLKIEEQKKEAKKNYVKSIYIYHTFFEREFFHVFTFKCSAITFDCCRFLDIYSEHFLQFWFDLEFYFSKNVVFDPCSEVSWQKKLLMKY